MSQQHDPNSVSSVNAQMQDMIDELYNDEMTISTAPFVPMEGTSSSMQYFGSATRPTTMSLPSSIVSSPSVSNRSTRPVHVPVTVTSSSSSSSTIASRQMSGDSEQIIISQPNYANGKYRCRTLGAHNMVRMAILPLFPWTNVLLERTAATTAAATTTEAEATSISLYDELARLLLANVPLHSLTAKQNARTRPGTFPALFKLEINYDEYNENDSFLIGFYQDFYGNLSKRLQVDISILDYNCTRLRQCIDLVVRQYGLEQTMLYLDELPYALEFYLQIDVDLFYMKTCSFNGVKPRLFEQRFHEGLFCFDKPIARFTITQCGKSSCHCCHSPYPRHDSTTVIPFAVPHTHRFVNQYEAILNCPATCESKNCIYVLTCPCEKFDFIDESKVSFAETLAIHREEGNRIIREFLIGSQNMEYLTQGLKSEKKKANDKLWLYQHSAHCSVALKYFLDDNPEYWCFVPTRTFELQQSIHSTTLVRSYLARQSPSTREVPLPPERDLSMAWTRKDADVRLLVENLPEPPCGYSFTAHQRQQQANFFKWTQDRNVPLYNVDLYNANIIAILPENVSKLFRKLITSLLITHAESKLNETGHLLRDQSSTTTTTTTTINPNLPLKKLWCVNLIHRPT